MHQIENAAPLTIPEVWMSDWIESGYRQITDYLAKYAAYLAYCAEHDLEP